MSLLFLEKTYDIYFLMDCFSCVNRIMQLAVEYESNALFVKVDTDNEYEFAHDMQVFFAFINLFSNYDSLFAWISSEIFIRFILWKLTLQNLSQVRGLPTLFFISPDSNKDVIRTEGLIPAQMIRDIIDNEMWDGQESQPSYLNSGV